MRASRMHHKLGARVTVFLLAFTLAFLPFQMAAYATEIGNSVDIYVAEGSEVIIVSDTQDDPPETSEGEKETSETADDADEPPVTDTDPEEQEEPEASDGNEEKSGIESEGDTESEASEQEVEDVDDAEKDEVEEEEAKEGGEAAEETKAIATAASFSELQNAIDGAVDGDTIEITTYFILTSPLQVDKSLTFKAGDGLTSVQLIAMSDRHMEVSGGGITLAFDKVVLDGGMSGGGINSTADTLILKDATITNCVTSGEGGAVSVYGGSLVLKGVDIRGNRASSGGGVIATNIVMESGSVTNNTADVFGGGLYANTLQMTGGTVSGNGAEHGAGVAISQDGWMELDGGSVVNNTAGTNGGGIFAHEGSGLTMTGGTVSGNSAVYAGGVYGHVGGVIAVSGGEVSGNSATEGGGILARNLELTGGIIEDNHAAKGGGVFLYDFYITMEDGVIRGNTAEQGGGIYGHNGVDISILGGEITENEAAGDGGGIWTDNLAKLQVRGDAVLAENASSQAWYMEDESDMALYNRQVDGTVTISEGFEYAYNNNDIVYTKGSTEPPMGDGKIVDEATLRAALQKALSEGTSAVLEIAVNEIVLTEPIDIPNGTVTFQKATGVEGSVTIKAPQSRHITGYNLKGLYFEDVILDGDSSGGGIELPQLTYGIITVSGAVIQNCVAPYQSHGQTYGGAIYFSYSNLRLENSRLIGNSASHGGAVYAERALMTSIVNCQFDDNTATYGGAALHFTGYTEMQLDGCRISGSEGYSTAHLTAGDITINNTTFNNNETYLVLDINSYTADFDNSVVIQKSRITDNSTPVLIIATTCNLSIIDSAINNNQHENLVALEVGNSNVLFERSEMIGNHTSESSTPGIAASDNSIIIIKDSQINDNSAEAAMAGAILLQGSELTVEGGEIKGNAVLGKEDTYIYSGQGGAINALYGSRVHINGGVIRENSVNAVSSDLYPASGGGIYAYESAITLNDATLEANCAERGGGIYADNSSVAINSATIQKNTAELGGGIYINNCDLTVDGSLLLMNFAEQAGGGVYSEQTSPIIISRSQFVSNTTSGDGGAIFTLQLANLQVRDNSSFVNNTAQQAARIKDSDIALHDQNIDTSTEKSFGLEYLYNNYDVSYYGSVIDPGIVEITDGFELQQVLNSELESGKNVISLLIAADNLHLPSTILIDRDVTVIFSAADGIQDVIIAPGDNYHFETAGSNVTLRFFNITLYGNGGTGGIYAGAGHTIVDGVTILECKRGMYDETPGGGIYAAGNLTLRNSTVDGCEAWQDGAGIYAEANLAIEKSRITNNHSETGRGGGIHVLGSATIKNSFISNNQAYFEGGGIYSEGPLTVENTDIKNNEAMGGGGICVPEIAEIPIIVTNSLIEANRAGDGGGIVSPRLTLNKSIVRDNTADFDGGGLLIPGLYDDRLEVEECTISGNSSGERGGGVRIGGGLKTYVYNSTFTGNHAGTYGGAIDPYYLYELEVRGYTVFNSNSAGAGFVELPNSEDIITHDSYIDPTVTFSEGAQYGYNNYDITYIR